MAGVDVNEEFAAIDGIVATGEYGVAVAPTNATDVLGGTWTDQGETTDAGVVRSQVRTVTTRRGWQRNRKLRALVTEGAVRFQFTLVQTNADSIELFHGMPLTAGSIVTDPTRDWPLIAFDLDMVDTGIPANGVIREYAPSARVVEVGDRTAVAGVGVTWNITVEAEYDDTIQGYTQVFYSSEESPAVPVLTSALPTAVAAGGWVEVIGTGVGSTVSLTVGGVNAPVFNRIDKTHLHFKMPAGSAGSAPIIVTNAGGASSGLSYTRGA